MEMDWRSSPDNLHPSFISPTNLNDKEMILREKKSNRCKFCSHQISQVIVFIFKAAKYNLISPQSSLHSLGSNTHCSSPNSHI